MSNEIKKQKRRRIHIPESVRKTGLTGLGIYAYLLAASAIHEQLGNFASPISTSLSRANEAMNNSGIGHYGLVNPMKFISDMVAQTVQIDPSRPELINFVDILLLGIPLVTIGTLGLGELVKYLTENKSRLYGTESVKGIPSHVIIAPTTKILEGMVDSATSSGRLRNSKNNEIVGIHLDQGIPLSLLKDNKIGHHFAIESTEALIGLPGAKEDEVPPLIHESGLDRAREITINCVPDSSSLFYSEYRSLFGPETIMAILGKIKVKGKKINIILPREIKIERIDTVAERLIKWQKRLSGYNVDFELNIITPEDEFIGSVREKASKIALKKESNEPVYMLVLGQQTFDPTVRFSTPSLDQSETDTQPLPNQMNFLLDCLMRGKNPTDDEGRILAEGVLISEYDVKSSADELSKQITKGDLIILTAQSDRELITLTKQLVEAYGLLRGRMIVIADKESTAEYLEKEFKVDTFVASRAINEAFAKK